LLVHTVATTTLGLLSQIAHLFVQRISASFEVTIIAFLTCRSFLAEAEHEAVWENGRVNKVALFSHILWLNES
jgi:hypothetical protein